ncbi:MAG TPA: SIS domain-containing protein [Solirubrobacterales bacterium]
MEPLHETYFDRLNEILERIRVSGRESIPAAAEIIAGTVARGGVVHAFGSGHSQLLAIDLAGRAGGLASVNVIFDPGTGRAENLEGYAATLLRDVVFEAADCLIVISNSGRNPSPIEMAMAGKAAGVPVIAVTSVAFSRRVTSRHSSGRKLYEIADVVLDLCGEAGDAAVPLPGGVSVGPTSTAAGSALLQATVAAAAARIQARGLEPPLFVSQNLDGSADHNEELRARYRGRVHVYG